mmetsp:Transcript_18999/g.40067  ORF Transcript_18999/g.40067 Transcript_18999/m.40067 type:complete len:521 (-) Transcript_18999:92-1654(-)
MIESSGSKMERPKRPLSAYNLYYRFKRCMIVEAHKNGRDSKEAIIQLIMAAPGLEKYPSISSTMSDEHVRWLRRTEIRSALRENLSAKDEKSRNHRKSHGCISFLEMNEIVSVSWKSIDDFSRSIFEELAEEGRRSYRKRVAAYKEHLQASSPKKKKKKSKFSISTKTPEGGDTLKHNVDDIAMSSDSISTHRKTQMRSREGSASPRSMPAVVDLKQRSSSDDIVGTKGEKSSQKTIEKPKRPLSAYNLFYRFKRSKVVEATKNGSESKEEITKLITAVPGLEEYPSVAMSSEHSEEIRRSRIRSELLQNLYPKDTSRRSHRKSHGGVLSFLEMTDLISASWKSIDDYTRSVFEELAEEGRQVYYKRLADYEEDRIASSNKAELGKAAVSEKPQFDLDDEAMNQTASNEHCKDSSVCVRCHSSLDILEPLPIFRDAESSDEESSSFASPFASPYTSPYASDTVSSVGTQPSRHSSMRAFDDRPLPFSGAEERENLKRSGSDASVDDFMRLFAALDKNLTD